MRLTFLDLGIVPLFIVFLLNVSFADTVILKSGKIIEGRITEKTNEYIKIDTVGMSLYYERKYISSIDEKSNSSPMKEDIKEEGAAAYLKRGLEAAKNAEFTKARYEFKEGLKISPSDENISGALAIIEDLDSGVITEEYAVNVFKGSYYLLNEQYQDAIVYLEKALQSNIDSPDLCYNLAAAYLALKDLPRAIKYLDKLVKLSPDDAYAYELLGNAHYMAGDTQKAKEYLAIARELFRKSSPSF